jgi:large subunit ribosomal protein L3
VLDAVKKPLPKDAPKPGKFKVAGGEKVAEAPAQQEGA